MRTTSPRRRRGANMVEFVIILPVFITILAGAIDFGWLFFHNAAIDVAVHAGCRAGAIVDPGTGEANATDVLDAAQDRMTASLAESQVTCDGCVATAALVGTNPERTLQCSMTNDFTPLFGLFVSPMTLDAQAARRLEWQR